MNINDFQMVWVTAPNLETARRLVKGAVENRLAACGKVLSPVESHYWWEGKLECGQEYQLVFKTHRDCFQRLQEWIMEQHPYDVPEFVAIPITEGSPAYLQWIRAETRSA